MSEPKYYKKIIILANSRKTSGRCVAGKTDDGTWVRPVSSRPSSEISEWDRSYKDGTKAAPLHIANIGFLGLKQHAYQPENHLIHDGYYWGHKGSIGRSRSLELLDTPITLWNTGDNDSYSGINDRILEISAPAKVEELGGSLQYIRVADLQIKVSQEGIAFGNQKMNVRGYFTYNGIRYALMVTSPYLEDLFKAKAAGTYDVGDASMCISVGEPHNGYAYKLIASIIYSPALGLT